MTSRYLVVTFVSGQPLAAYLRLADVAADGKPIGIEITAPSKVTVTALNRALHALGVAKVTDADLAPLSAARNWGM